VFLGEQLLNVLFVFFGLMCGGCLSRIHNSFYVVRGKMWKNVEYDRIAGLSWGGR
jgi:hypothetical protein